MTHDTTSLTEDMPVREAVEKFVTTGTSGFPVMDKDGGTELKGILSLADILWHEAMEEIIEEEKVRESSERVNRPSPANRAASLSMHAHPHSCESGSETDPVPDPPSAPPPEWHAAPGTVSNSELARVVAHRNETQQKDSLLNSNASGTRKGNG